MSPYLILFIIFAYFAILFTISYIAGKKADQTTFYTGGRNNHWLLVAISTIGAAMSGVTFVSVPGMVGVSGWGYMQMVIGFTIGQLILAYVLVPLYYKHNLFSIYQYLDNRLGTQAYHTGAWFFFISKLLGASVRLFIVTEVLQLLVFAPLGIPYWANAIFAVAIAYLCTFKGGVKSLIWTDVLKTFCMIAAIVLSIYYVLQNKVSLASDAPHIDSLTRLFYFDDTNHNQYFWKQILAGILLIIGMTGIDQDMMQRTLSCKNTKESQKNILLGAFLQVLVIALFLFLGTLLYSYAYQNGIDISAMKADDVYPYFATHGYFPTIVGVFFIIGFIASAYSSACGSLTALTTSFSVDILGISSPQNTANTSSQSQSNKHAPSPTTTTPSPTVTTTPSFFHRLFSSHSRVHIFMAILMAATIMCIHLLNNDSVIQTLFFVASYTYGPLLGLFLFAILTPWQVKGRFIPLYAILSPVLTYIIDTHSALWFNGYIFSHERLLVNALFMFLFLTLSIRSSQPSSTSQKYENS